LENAAFPSYDKTTSRWQTKTSLWSLSFYYSVIPCVSFICCSMIISVCFIGSISQLTLLLDLTILQLSRRLPFRYV